MVSKEGVDYIKSQLAAGTDRQIIKNSLLSNGWLKEDVEAAFGAADLSPNQLPSEKSPAATVEQKPQGSKIGLIVGIILAVLLIAGGTFAYSYFYSPEKNVARALGKISGWKTFTFHGEIKGNLTFSQSEVLTTFNNLLLPGSGTVTKKIAGVSTTLAQNEVNTDVAVTADASNPVNFTLSYDGAEEIDPANPKSAVTISAKLSEGEVSGSGTIETRLVDKSLYGRLVELNFSDFQMNVDSVKNQWYKFDLSQLQKEIGSSAAEPKIDDAAKKKLLEDLSNYKVFKITKLKGEKVGSVATYHYKLITQKENLKNYLVSANTTTGSAFSEQEMDSILAEIDKVKVPDIEIWIGRSDFNLYKVATAVEETGNPSFDQSTKIHAESFFQFSNFNKAVDIKAPDSSKSFTEFEKSLAEISVPQTGQSGVLQADADKDGLSDQLESVYGTDANNPDTDGDGFKDGDEVANGYNPKGAGKIQ